MDEDASFCTGCGQKLATDANFCTRCGHARAARLQSRLPMEAVVFRDPVSLTAATGGAAVPDQPVLPSKSSWKIVRNVVLGGLLIVVALAAFVVYTITRPDPDGYRGLSPLSSERALYYMRKQVRGIAADQGFRNIVLCDGGNVTKPGAFVYLIDSCFEYGSGDGRARVPFFVQMDRIPPDGQTYSVVQFKAGQPALVTPPKIADASGRTPRQFHQQYSERLIANIYTRLAATLCGALIR
jgi:hypothetical protein